MKSKNSLSVLCAVVAFGLLGCSSHESTITQISGHAILNSDALDNEKAEQLAKSAEILLTAEGFEQANKLSSEALRLDPTNFRAGFIHALTAPLVLQKGLLNRLKPLAKTHPKLALELERNIQENAQTPFVLMNAEDHGLPLIETEAQFHAHLDRTIIVINESRLYLKANKQKELKMKASSLLAKGLLERYVDACVVETTAELEYKLTCPKTSTRFEVGVNRADIEIIQDMAAYAQIYFIALNGYDVSGAVATGSSNYYDKRLSNEELTKALLKNPAFATLRAGNNFENFKALGLDFLNGINYAMNNQKEFCPMGTGSSNNRVGQLINNGLCVDSFFQPLMAVAHSVLEGKTTEAWFSDGGPSYVTMVNALTFFSKPTSDLRQLGPFKFNKCGGLERLTDETLGGVFVKADANRALSVFNKKCL